MMRLNTPAANWGRYFLLSAFICAAWLGIFSVLPAFGEEKGMKILTREEALKIALEKNKDIQKAREYKNSVEGRYVEERSAALPQLTLSGGIHAETGTILLNHYSKVYFPRRRKPAL